MSLDVRKDWMVVPPDLAKLFEGLDHGIIVTNGFGEIVVMNSVARLMFGISEGANTRKLSSEVFSSFRDQLTMAKLQPENLPFMQTISTGRGVSGREYFIVNAHGHGRHLQISTTPIFNSENVRAGALAILVDITDRRRLEETLTQRNIQLNAINNISMLLNRTIDFREVLEYSVRKTMEIFDGDAGALLLPDRGDRRLFLAASANLSEDFITEVHGSLISKTLFGTAFSSDKVISLDNLKVASGIPESLRNSQYNSVVIFPLRAKRKPVGIGALFSESKRVLEDSQREVIEGIGTVIGAAIENARLHEETIQKTRLLESKNKELQQFTYAITHDLKSPILVIEGFARELKRVGNIGTEQEVLVDAILSAAGRLHSLVNDLLELGRIGSVEAPVEEADIGEIVKSVLKEVSIRLTEKKIKVEMEGNFPRLYVVVKYVERIYSNLIDNAIKYMGDQPEPKLVLGSQDKGDHFLFYVKDNGIGIPSEFHDRIFAIFQRVKSSDTEKVEGSGLGLAFVKKIVELSGGNVWVESAGKLKGSTFYFTLPKQ